MSVAERGDNRSVNVDTKTSKQVGFAASVRSLDQMVAMWAETMQDVPIRTAR